MDTWQEHIDLCRSIAKRAHAGQHRRGGDPYINHPNRVAQSFDGMHACVAWLHDVIEDTDETADSLLASRVDSSVVEAVVLMTKQDGEDYWDYLTRVKRHPIALRVKIADMLDNLCDQPTAKQRDKYRDGILYLAT